MTWDLVAARPWDAIDHELMAPCGEPGCAGGDGEHPHGRTGMKVTFERDIGDGLSALRTENGALEFMRRRDTYYVSIVVMSGNPMGEKAGPDVAKRPGELRALIRALVNRAREKGVKYISADAEHPGIEAMMRRFGATKIARTSTGKPRLRLNVSDLSPRLSEDVELMAPCGEPGCAGGPGEHPHGSGGAPKHRAFKDWDEGWTVEGPGGSTAAKMRRLVGAAILGRGRAAPDEVEFARRTMAYTQARLQSGPETLTLYRAVPPAVVKGTRYTPLVLESWTPDRAVAASSGSGYVVMKAQVPRGWVFATPETHAGFRNDNEVLVVGKSALRVKRLRGVTTGVQTHPLDVDLSDELRDVQLMAPCGEPGCAGGPGDHPHGETTVNGIREIRGWVPEAVSTDFRSGSVRDKGGDGDVPAIILRTPRYNARLAVTVDDPTRPEQKTLYVAWVGQDEGTVGTRDPKPGGELVKLLRAVVRTAQREGATTIRYDAANGKIEDLLGRLGGGERRDGSFDVDDLAERFKLSDTELMAPWDAALPWDCPPLST